MTLTESAPRGFSRPPGTPIALPLPAGTARPIVRAYRLVLASRAKLPSSCNLVDYAPPAGPPHR